MIPSPIIFREDRDLIGTRVGYLREECGRRYIDVSPAMLSLHQTDKCAFYDSLAVVMPDGKIRLGMEIDGGKK
jgi:hypothetical protein